jgi:hypothetical protein
VQRVASGGANVSERKHWKFWVIDYSGRPVEADGYECPPNDDIWWFPSCGFSTSVVYRTEAEAKLVALEQAARRLREAEDIYSELIK